MKFWQSMAWAEADQLPAIAKFAEEVGFHGVMNADHLFLTQKTNSPYPYSADGKMHMNPDSAFPEVWSSFGAMAAVTTRLHLSTSVYLLPLRNPIELAKAAGTCAIISSDRVSIGFGVGWMKEEFDAAAVDFHTRGRRTDEMIEVMRKLWRGVVVSHEGDFFRFCEIEVRPIPDKPVPFYCGGGSPAALRRAARSCDGFIGPGCSIDEAPALLAELNRLRREAGRDKLPFETIVPIFPPDPTGGLDDVKRLHDMGGTATIAPPFNIGGLDRGRTAGLGQSSTIDDKKRVMERYAENVIRKMS